MKKLLTLLGAVGLITIATTTVVACGNREKGKLVNITEFEKKVIFEAQGRHQTIDQAKEAIAIISDLPEGIESINVTTVNNNIKVVFIAQDGYQTPNPLIIKFIKNNKQENKITKELVDAELTKLLVKEKTYETDELAIAAIQAIETDAFKVKEASKLTKAFEQHTFNVIVEAKSGYVLAEGIEEGQTTIELSIGKADQQLTKALVDEQLSKLLVEEKTYETDELAIAAIQAVETDAFKVKEASKLTKAFEQHTFNVIVEAKSGYVLVEGIEEGQTTIELSVGEPDIAVTKTGIDAEIERIKSKVSEITFINGTHLLQALNGMWTLEGTNVEVEWATKSENQQVFVTSTDLFRFTIGVEAGYSFEQSLELEGEKYVTEVLITYKFKDQEIKKWAIEEEIEEVKAKVSKLTIINEAQLIGALNGFWGLEGTNVEVERAVEPANQSTFGTYSEIFKFTIGAEKGYAFQEGIELQDGKYITEASVIYNFDNKEITKLDIDQAIDEVKDKIGELEIINEAQLIGALNGYWDLKGTSAKVERVKKLTNKDTFATTYTDNFRFIIEVNADYYFAQTLELKDGKYITEELITYHYK